MVTTSFNRKRIRRGFGKIPSISIPSLVDLQWNSYESFLQMHKSHNDRTNTGLEGVLRSTFPVSDYDNRATVEYVQYRIGSPKFDQNESIHRGVSYAAPLFVTLRIVMWDIDDDGKKKDVKGVKEQEILMGEIPLMTEGGTFIINGARRVVVSQMHRSPGVFYFHDDGKNSSSGKYLYSARVIPYRGSWLDLEFDTRDLLFFRIDRKRKLLISTLLLALGYSRENIIKEFYKIKTFERKNDAWITIFDAASFKGIKLSHDIIDANTGEVIISNGTYVTSKIIKEMSANDVARYYVVQKEDIIGASSAVAIFNDFNDKIVNVCGVIGEATLQYIESSKRVKELKILDIACSPYGGEVMRDTLLMDKNETCDDALIDIYRVLRPGDPPSIEIAENMLHNAFFEPNLYDLSAVGRMKINLRHGIHDVPEEFSVLRKEDIIMFVRHLIYLKETNGVADDIDSLSNRRVRSVGELIENQFRIGLVRIKRTIASRMNSVEIDSAMLRDIVNPKALMSILIEFFCSSQLSQFMDQTNPLSKITHTRRISALGPGGLNRERAGFEVRDVNPSHYGRICPIETPEGQNIGLINSLATHASINKYGFLETPYKKVVNHKVINEICYLSAIEEGDCTIAQAGVRLDKDGTFLDNVVSCRKEGEFVMASVDEIDYIDVSPRQLVSVAAALIPFLENDDANRALMGSNMQRQAVPLIRSVAPFIGTGMESIVARDSGALVTAKRDGIVHQVDASRIVIRSQETSYDSLGVDMYHLEKFQKSNQGTCMNQRPIVSVGDYVKKGDVIADGSCTDKGELAVGQNVLVAFMSWYGYSFEDSIVMSQRLVRDGVYNSIHIQEFDAIVRDTTMGPEETVAHPPHVLEEHLIHLDESGIVRIGAEVQGGDVLVGKVTPKAELPLTPEEKLLKAIFGEKVSAVKDSSLRMPLGERGTVINVKVFTRRGIQKDERTIALEHAEIAKLTKDRDERFDVIEEFLYREVSRLLIGRRVISGISKQVSVGTIIDEHILQKLAHHYWWNLTVDCEDVMQKIAKLRILYNETKVNLDNELKTAIECLQSGDGLPQGALKVIKVYVATKSRLQPGDKMAGRHGNKGVVARIVPIEDMPFLEDGTPIDVVLNSLGVSSRMNVGQILETHLGWASANLGKQVSQLLAIAERSRSAADMKRLREKIISIYDGGECYSLYGVDNEEEGDDDSDNGDVAKITIEKMSNDDIISMAKDMCNGIYMATPVFDGASEEDINSMLAKANLDTSGQVTLYDGRTGERFMRKITVGNAYIMKLLHLIDDKMHARSTGPYSLVAQQPLGGKAYYGGQRFGEMECWAMQAYGSAYTLQEMLTIKSDDVIGRVRAYERIIRGEVMFDVGVPESFKVMLKEVQALGLDMTLISDEDRRALIKKRLYNISSGFGDVISELVDEATDSSDDTVRFDNNEDNFNDGINSNIKNTKPKLRSDIKANNKKLRGSSKKINDAVIDNSDIDGSYVLVDATSADANNP